MSSERRFTFQDFYELKKKYTYGCQIKDITNRLDARQEVFVTDHGEQREAVNTYNEAEHNTSVVSCVIG